jgi:hypothetical protein
MLGHEVPFSYCRAPASELPCRRVFDCWWETFDIDSFIRAHYEADEIDRILSPRQGKMLTLVELIERAKKAQKDAPDQGS